MSRLLGLAGALASAGVLAFGGLVFADEQGPSIAASTPAEAFEEVIQPEELQKVFYVKVQFSEGSAPQLISAELILDHRRALTAAGPSPLRISIKDALLEEVGGFEAPNPLLLHGPHLAGEPGIVPQAQGIGDFLFPFTREAKTAEIYDVESGSPSPLISVDLTPAIDAFCAANASDTDCVARSDTQAPTVGWLRPAPQSPGPAPELFSATIATLVVTMDGSYELEAQASDDMGLPLVTFSASGVVICQDDAPPYQCDWNAKLGTYTLTVQARDGGGNTASSSIDVLVVAPPEF